MRMSTLCSMLLVCLVGGFGAIAPAGDSSNPPESPKAVEYPMRLSPPGIRKITPMAEDGRKAELIPPAYFEVVAAPPEEALVWERSSADGDLEVVGLEILERGFQVDWRVQDGTWRSADTLAEGTTFASGPLEALEPEMALRFGPGDVGLADKANPDGSSNIEPLSLEFRLRAYLVYRETHGGKEAHTIVSDWSNTVKCFGGVE